MSDFSVLNGTYPSCSYQPYPNNQGAQNQPPAQIQPTTHAEPSLPTGKSMAGLQPPPQLQPASKTENARESRNKAEKQRRDKMNQSISFLASIVPPVVMASRRVDKTSVLRLTAHYLRSHQHVFGSSIRCRQRFSPNFTKSVLRTMKGFVLTTTYKGLVVVVSPNVQEYLGYTELELLGQNLYSIVHQEDHQLLSQQLLPKSCRLTSNGELFLSNEPDSAEKAAAALKNEKRSFIIRFKKLSHPRSEPAKYITCHVEGSFRKSDCAGVYVDRHVQIGRRVRSRGNNPYASGNDIVFVGVVRPITETFKSESRIEVFRMEYRTRHSIDGSIIQCEQRICLITGYMTHEVTGVNAMNFMHRDDVRWVVIALREMYVNHRLVGESCYRLMTKNGKFLHMRTTGVLDVDPKSKEATSFVCTNTVVPEEEGKELIKQMKKKFSFQINEEPKDDENGKPEGDENQSLPIEDPRQLEQVIYHLVTDLPSPRPEEARENHETSSTELAIIPPKREKIKEAIEKSYNVFKTLRQTDPTNNLEKICTEKSTCDTVQNSNTLSTLGDIETNFEVTQAPVRQNENVEYEFSLPQYPFTPNCNSNTLGDMETNFEVTQAPVRQNENVEYDFALPESAFTLNSTMSNQPNHEEVSPHTIDQLGQCRQSTIKLHLNMSKDSEYNDEIPKNYNYLDSPSAFCDMYDLVRSNDIESDLDTRNSVQPSFVKLPEVSTTSYMETNNISFVAVDRSVSVKLPDFGISPEEIDCLINSALNDGNLFERAAQASCILNETNIDDLQASEIESSGMEFQLTQIETQQNQECCLAENFEISQNTEQDTAANTHEQNNPQEPVNDFDSIVNEILDMEEWEERKKLFYEETFKTSQNTEKILTVNNDNPKQNDAQLPLKPIASTGSALSQSQKLEETREFFYKENFEISQNTKKISTANNNTPDKNNTPVKMSEITGSEMTELNEFEERQEFFYKENFEISQNTKKILTANNTTLDPNNPQLPLKPIENTVNRCIESYEREESREFSYEENFEISQNTMKILTANNNTPEKSNTPVKMSKITGSEMTDSYEFEERREFFYKENFEISQNTKKILTANNTTLDQSNPQLPLKPIENTVNGCIESYECEESGEFSYEESFEISQNTETIKTGNNNITEQNNLQLLESNESFGNSVVCNDPYEFHSDEELPNPSLRRKTSGKEKQ